MTVHAIKYNHKPTDTPPSTFIAAADNHLLTPSDDNNDNDAHPENLMGKYDNGVNKRVKGGHHRRYRDDDNIEDLHGIYKEPKDDNNNGRDNENDYVDWDNTGEKEPEEDYDDGNDVVSITAVQLFGISDKAFLGKETDNKKQEEE